MPGTIAGTVVYMSPEQATGAKVDARSDTFSFGAELLNEMVTGVRAFAGTSTADTLSAVLRAQPKPPTAVVAECADRLEKVVLRCLRKDPEWRFQHMADVKVALLDVKEESESAGIKPQGSCIATAVYSAGCVDGRYAGPWVPAWRRGCSDHTLAPRLHLCASCRSRPCPDTSVAHFLARREPGRVRVGRREGR